MGRCSTDGPILPLDLVMIRRPSPGERHRAAWLRSKLDCRMALACGARGWSQTRHATRNCRWLPVPASHHPQYLPANAVLPKESGFFRWPAPTAAPLRPYCPCSQSALVHKQSLFSICSAADRVAKAAGVSLSRFVCRRGVLWSLRQAPPIRRAAAGLSNSRSFRHSSRHRPLKLSTNSYGLSLIPVAFKRAGSPSAILPPSGFRPCQPDPAAQPAEDHRDLHAAAG